MLKPCDKENWKSHLSEVQFIMFQIRFKFNITNNPGLQFKHMHNEYIL